MHDPYVDLKSGCLLNLFGLTDPADLQSAERSAVLLREQSVRTHGLPGTYDLPHVQTLHRELFQDIYSWAGQIRTVSIVKTLPFCLPAFIEEQSASLLTRLADEKHLRDLNREQFLDRLTHYMAELNAIHPFREGNGRTQRAFFEQLGGEAGHQFDWSMTDQDRNTQAHQAAMDGDLALLRALLGAVVVQGR